VDACGRDYELWRLAQTGVVGWGPTKMPGWIQRDAKNGGPVRYTIKAEHYLTVESQHRLSQFKLFFHSSFSMSNLAGSHPLAQARVTVLAIVNADGSAKRKLLLINRLKVPKAFRQAISRSGQPASNLLV
jgi:hypothetical protein